MPLEHQLVLDCGDFVGGSRPLDRIKAKNLLKGMMLAGYDVVNLGERDFLQGPQFLLDMKEQHGIPFISANIFHEDSTTRFTEPYLIKKLEGKQVDDNITDDIKVGIFGLAIKRARLVYNDHKPQLIVKDPIETAQEMVRELEGKCDLIIALAHLPSNQLHDLKNEVRGIDIIIGGHSFSRIQGPFMQGQAILLEPGSKGQAVGEIAIQLDKDKKIVSGESKNVLLKEEIVNDPGFDELLRAYDQEYGDYFRTEREKREKGMHDANAQD